MGLKQRGQWEFGVWGEVHVPGTARQLSDHNITSNQQSKIHFKTMVSNSRKEKH